MKDARLEHLTFQRMNWQVWESDSGTLLHTLKGHSDAVRSLCWSPDEVTLVSTSLDNTVRCWRAQWEPSFEPLPLLPKSSRSGPTSVQSTSDTAGLSAWQAALAEGPTL